MQSAPVNDEPLKLLISKGDREAFSLFYTQHVKNLYKYVYLICKSTDISEDIVQQLFINLWENKNQVTSVSCLKSYMFRSAKNLLIDHLRKEQLKNKALFKLSAADISDVDCDSKLQVGQYLELIREAVNLLPPKRKLIVEMRTNNDLSLDEIAVELGISKNVVKKQLYRGMAFLRTHISSQLNIIALVFFLIENNF